jgi:DNA-binding NtrC family response regulator
VVKRAARDLFYRLNVIPIHRPAAAQRREDIALLIAHFIQRSRETGGTSQDRPDALVLGAGRATP